MNKGHILEKMDGQLTNRIEMWISSFEKENLVTDSYHIDEILNSPISKNDWIQIGFELFSLIQKIIRKHNSNIYVLLCYELNVTKNPRPFPQQLSPRLFVNTNCQPEIMLCKERPNDVLLDGSVFLPVLSDKYKKKVFGTHRSEDVHWRWLFFT